MTTPAIEFERVLPVDLDTAWKAWIDPVQAGSWFAIKANIVPEIGGPYELFWSPNSPHHDSTLGCRITALAPQRFLAFTWRGPDALGAVVNEGNPPPPPTHVTVTFQAAGHGTRIRVRHVGFGDGRPWSQARSWHEQAWSRCMRNLDAYLAGRPLSSVGLMSRCDPAGPSVTTPLRRRRAQSSTSLVVFPALVVTVGVTSAAAGGRQQKNP
jgi:uncharacterized protein YndB with AHSA1/START domain